MIDPWVWALLLLAVGLSLTTMEVFFPSGGLIGFLAAAAIVAATIMAFRQSLGVGVGVLIGALVGVPIVVAIGFQLWPKTAMGRRMLLMPPADDQILPDSPKHRQLKGLIGRVGYAKSTMLPSGAVIIDGRIIDAMSEGMPIEIGQAVRVIEVRANRVVVRPVDEQTPTVDAANPLQRPMDSIGPDPFGEAPA
jgi:membrane-bound serine protease (ClpP class)